jgi:putative transposase
MARLPRLTVPDFPHHIIQRGNNQQPIFIDTRDYESMLDLLDEHARREKVALHSYVLMGNHFHLLATPPTLEAMPRMMQGVGRRYVRLFNQRHRRTGTLWEGRYRATPVQTERYLLACMAYIDLNPVRAGVVARPEDYPWSSYAHYRGLRADKRVSPHPIYWQLGNTPFEREARYGEWVAQGLELDVQRRLTDATLKGWALGDPEFVSDLQARTPRRVGPARKGRPHAISGTRAPTGADRS